MNAIIFDFNGVVVDDEPLHARAFATVLRASNIELTEDLYFGRYLGLDDRGLFVHVLADHGRPSPSATELSALVEDKAQAYLRELDAGFTLCDGARSLILDCQELPLAIGSGARNNEIALILERAELAHCFDAIVSADDVRAGKPDPETYTLALERLRAKFPGLQAADCVVIEDAPHGLDAARTAGMRTVAVCGSRGREDLMAADRVVDSLAELTASDLIVPG